MEPIWDLGPQLANNRVFWLGFGAEDRQDNGLTLYRSGLPDSQLNGVLRVAPGSLNRTCVPAAQRWLDGVPWRWWAGPDSDPELPVQLLSGGAELVQTQPVMSVDLDRVTPAEPVPGLDIREVTDGDLGAWVRAYAPSFGVPAEQFGPVTRLEQQRPGQDASEVRLAGWLDGQIVASSVLLDRCGVAGVYAVTTTAGYRRRGIGAAMTAAALRAGRERGRRIGTLQASSMGQPVYLRMGFQVVAEYQIFTLPPVSQP
ncbi:MAG TPA: GNAT family N-acetyltransferase [Streptosporangiaceae bacterium]|nr:GNAT family N-acetyltransferase [Streptosporangiaceae bacterium]